jgi:hypothetical protein
MMTKAKFRDLNILMNAIEAKPVRTGLALSRDGLVRVVYIDGKRRYSLTSDGMKAAGSAYKGIR